MRFQLLAALALSGGAYAQITLPAHPGPANNGGSANWALFFDFTAAGSDVTVTELSTASTATAGAAFSVEVLTFVGSGLGGPVASGPGSSMAGWTSLGMANATQGPTSSAVSLLIDIPDVFVPAGQTVGVALLFSVSGPRYFGTGTGAPLVFADSNLTLTTGDSRSQPFTGSGSFFSPRALVGEVIYVLGAGGGIGSSYCGPAVPNSTGNPGELNATGSTLVADNNVTLLARSLPNGAFGYFLTSQTQGNTPNPAGSQGVLCLGGSIGRYVAPGQIQNSGMTGSFSLALDLTLTPTPAGLAPINAGETWNFQAWYRDQNPNVTSNFTDGRSIMFM